MPRAATGSRLGAQCASWRQVGAAYAVGNAALRRALDEIAAVWPDHPNWDGVWEVG